MTSLSVKMLRLFWTTMLRICELLASAVSQKIEISHLYDALTTVRPFGSNFRDQEAKMSSLMTYTTLNEALEPLHCIYKSVNLFEIG